MSDDQFDYKTFDAAAARELMPSMALEKRLRKALVTVQAAARSDRSSCCLPPDIIVGDAGAYDVNHPQNKPLVDELRKRGFRVESFYETRQFVDAGLKVFWDQ